MTALFVVNDPQDWPLQVPGATIVPARRYLTDAAYQSTANGAPTQVFNLCKFQRYQGVGYYVSLLAEARGHQPVPKVKTIRDLQSENITRILTEELDEIVQQELAGIPGPVYEVDIYFGHDSQRRHEQLGQQLFRLMQTPLLRARFEKQGERWRVHGLQAIQAKDVQASRFDVISAAAAEYIGDHERRRRRRAGAQPSLAILCSPDEAEPPSNPEAIRRFHEAAADAGLRSEIITFRDLRRIGEFDALFIRNTTAVNHYTYRFSRRATAEGLVVIDDPDSILRCSNKVYLAELLARHRIPAPKTMIVHRDNVAEVVPQLGLPCVLKKPDSAFSLGVVKVDTEPELAAKVDEFLEKSELIIAQESLMTEFDWRVGVLDRRPLFACKYMMAPGHWQVIKRQGERKTHEGETVALGLAQAPDYVVETAVKAANLVGDGLYGVDLKEVGGKAYVIEINDNPNIDAGNEDAIVGDALYGALMSVFAQRIEAMRTQPKDATR